MISVHNIILSVLSLYELNQVGVKEYEGAELKELYLNVSKKLELYTNAFFKGDKLQYITSKIKNKENGSDIEAHVKKPFDPVLLDNCVSSIKAVTND